MNKDEDIVEKVCRIISKIVLILFLLVFIYAIFDSVNMQVEQDKEFQNMVVELDNAKNEINELWDNIDAISEEYTTLYQEVYRNK